MLDPPLEIMLHQAHRSQAQENNPGIRVDLLHQNVLITAKNAVMILYKKNKTSVEERVRAGSAEKAGKKEERTTTLILPTGDEIGEF